MAHHITDCLITKKLHHKGTKTCLTPLLQGPCLGGEWVVLEDVTGVQTVSITGQIPVIGQA
jgi:hypothetical protein